MSMARTKRTPDQAEQEEEAKRLAEEQALREKFGSPPGKFMLASKVWQQADTFMLINISQTKSMPDDRLRDVHAPKIPPGVDQFALLRYSKKNWSLCTRKNGGEGLTLHEAMYNPRPVVTVVDVDVPTLKGEKVTRKENMVDILVDVVSQKWNGVKKEGVQKTYQMLIPMAQIINSQSADVDFSEDEV